MCKIKRMDQIRKILKCYGATKNIKATARMLNVSKNTVRTYIRRLNDRGKTLDDLAEISDKDFYQIIYKKKGEAQYNRLELFNSISTYLLNELKRVGVTRHLLWEEYRTQYGQGQTFGYSQFCLHLKRIIGLKDLTLAMQHVPGEVMQVDFAGKKLHWIDDKTGEVNDCEVLVAVMPFSHYTFAIALESQKVEDFVHGLNQAMLYFGKLPKVILSDNLKSFVTQANKYEPKFNELCEQLGAFYSIDLSAARVGKPKDKASVENGVKTVYHRIYGPLRNEDHHSLEALNRSIRNQLDIHNAKPYQKRSGSRKLVFEQMESPEMRDLPSDLFEIKKSTKAKVQRNYHVFLGEEKNYYSVPFEYALQNSIVVYNRAVVEVYIGPKRIAIHQRLKSRNNYSHQTNPKHLPSNHYEWKKAQGYDSAYFIKQAEKIGPAASWAIQQVILSKIYEVQTYNSCRGVLRLAEKYSPYRLEQACLRCKAGGRASYQMLNRILKRNLDQHEEEPSLFNVPEHQNIRGPEAYK